MQEQTEMSNKERENIKQRHAREIQEFEEYND